MSLVIAQETGDKSAEASAFSNIGNIYNVRGDYESAMKCLNKSLFIQQKIGDKRGEGTTLNNIGGLCSAQGDSDKALEYLKKSLVVQQEIGDSAGLCLTLFNISQIYFQNDDSENAFTSWVMAYKIANNTGCKYILQLLEELAPQLGLPDGLDGWEQLSQQMGEGE